MNNVVISGRLTKDIELKETKSDKVYCNFTVAVQRIGSDEADFINCTAWNKTAEIMDEFLKKGSKVAVIGALAQNIWTDKNDVKHYETYVNVDRVEFLDSKTEEVEDKPQKKYNRNSRK